MQSAALPRRRVRARFYYAALLRRSFKRAEKRAQIPQGAYINVRDRGMRKHDNGSRRKCGAKGYDLLRQVIRPFVRS